MPEESERMSLFSKSGINVSIILGISERNQLFYKTCTNLIGQWRSLVAYLNGVQAVGGSNPLCPTIDHPPKVLKRQFRGIFSFPSHFQLFLLPGLSDSGPGFECSLIGFSLCSNDPGDSRYPGIRPFDESKLPFPSDGVSIHNEWYGSYFVVPIYLHRDISDKGVEGFVAQVEEAELHGGRRGTGFPELVVK